MSSNEINKSSASMAPSTSQQQQQTSQSSHPSHHSNDSRPRIPSPSNTAPPPPPQPPPPPPSAPAPPQPQSQEQQQQSSDHYAVSSHASRGITKSPSMTSRQSVATTARNASMAASSSEGAPSTRLSSVHATAKRSSRLRQLSPAGSTVSYFSVVSPLDSKDPSPTYSQVMLHRLSQPIKEVEVIQREDDSLDSFSPSPKRVLSRPLEPRPPTMEEVDEAVASAWVAATGLPETVASAPGTPPTHAALGANDRRVMAPSVSMPVSNAEVLANYVPVMECVPPPTTATTVAAGPVPRTFSAPHLAVPAHEGEVGRLQTPVTNSTSSSGAEGGAVVTGGVMGPEEFLSRRSSQEVCCRICQETEPPLHVWCECKGTIGMAHKACLEEWLARSGATRCELCGFEYHTRRERRHASRLRSLRYWLRGNVMEQTALVADAVGAALCLAVGSGTAIVCGLGMASLRRGYRGGDASSDPDALFLQLMCVVASMVAVVWFVLAVRFHVRVWRRWWSTQYDIRVVPRSEESIQNSEARRALRRSKDATSLPVAAGVGVGVGVSVSPVSPVLQAVVPHTPTPSPPTRRPTLRRLPTIPRRGDVGWWARFWRGLTGVGGVRPDRRQGSDLRRERTRRLDEIADADLRAALSRWQARGRRFGLGFHRDAGVASRSSAGGVTRVAAASGGLRVANLRLPRSNNIERINLNRMYSPSRPRSQFFPMMDPLDAIWTRGGFTGYPMLSMPSSFVHQYSRRPRIPIPSPPFGALGPTSSSHPGIPSASFATPWTSPLVTPSGVSPRSASASTDRLWRL